MECSVVICTRNRAASLASVLASVAAMTIPAALKWELLVVDNGSVDGTPDTVDRFTGQLPITRVWEPNAGLSRARNAGVAAARGRYIVWTDDDVLVTGHWLAAFVEAFAAHPEAAIFAGRITPVLEPPTPEWFRKAMPDLHYLLATRDFGDVAVPLSAVGERLPFGASFAVRAAEQRQFLYDPDLGVAPNRRRGGEEVDVARAILAAGHSGWWVPRAEVRHLIASQRQTTAYVEQYYAAMGESWARTVPGRGVPVTTHLKALIGGVRYAAARAVNHPSWPRYLASRSFHRGARDWFHAHRASDGGIRPRNNARRS